MALIRRKADAGGRAIYEPRQLSEINFAPSETYGFEVDISDRTEMLRLAAEAMTSGNWTRATLATVHLRLPDLSDEAAIYRLQKAVITLNGETVNNDLRPGDARRTKRLRGFPGITACYCEPDRDDVHAIERRDVSGEPRKPRGVPGGGRWTTDGSNGSSPSRHTSSHLLQPVHAVPIPFPGTIPIPLTPRLLPPIPIIPTIPFPEGYFPTNPYPERAECGEEWAYAQEECRKLQARGKLGPRSGFGKNLARCILGMVSEERGGNPTNDNDDEGRLIA